MALVQRGDDGVDAAVAAGDDDHPSTRTVQHTVELAGVGRLGHLDGRLLPEDGQRRGEACVVGRAGIGVGDDQQRAHARTLAHRSGGPSHPGGRATGATARVR
jgi:hypothetical protein